MTDESLNNKKEEEGLSEEERIRREISEYQSLVEDELKPISMPFSQEREEEGEEKRIPPDSEPPPEPAQKQKPEVESPVEKKEASLVGEEKEAEKAEKETESTPVETHEEVVKQMNKLDVLQALAESYEQTTESEQDEVEQAEIMDKELSEFQEMLEEYIPKIQSVDVGEVMEVPVVVVRPDYALVDLGGKAEAVVDIMEFADEKGDINLHVGDFVKVMIMGSDEESGQVIVSHLKAKAKESLDSILNAFEDHLPVSGTVEDVVKSGVIVDVNDIRCFMPASQIDIKRVDDLSSMIGKEVSAFVIDADPAGKRLILSRRRLLEEENEKQRTLILNTLSEGDEVTGKVKAVMEFGVFVDLGGIDGFIPREECSWEKAAHPSEFFKEGRQAKVKVISVDKETGKITLSRRQLKPNPWDNVTEHYPEGKVVRGEVVALQDYGAFVRLAEGLTGLVHISDLSWTEHVTNPREHLKEGQRVRCVVLGVNKERQRLSLGLKQLSPDPWEDAKENYPPGTRVKGTIRSVNDKGVSLQIEDDVRGFIMPSELSWDKRLPKPKSMFKQGEEVEAMIIGYDDAQRILKLGIKQLSENPFDQYIKLHPEGSTVRGKVVKLTSFGAFVSLDLGIEGLVHVSQIDLKRIQDPKDVLQMGQTVFLKVKNIDREKEKISLSRRDYLLEQEKKEVAQFLKSKDSGGIKLGELLKDIPIETSDDE